MSEKGGHEPLAADATASSELPGSPRNNSVRRVPSGTTTPRKEGSAAARTRSLSSPLTLGVLREELDKFAADRFQTELKSLQEHMDKMFQKHCQNASFGTPKFVPTIPAAAERHERRQGTKESCDKDDTEKVEKASVANGSDFCDDQEAVMLAAAAVDRLQPTTWALRRKGFRGSETTSRNSISAAIASRTSLRIPKRDPNPDSLARRRAAAQEIGNGVPLLPPSPDSDVDEIGVVPRTWHSTRAYLRDSFRENSPLLQPEESEESMEKGREMHRELEIAGAEELSDDEPEEEMSKCFELFLIFVSSAMFDHVTTCAVVANALNIGLQTDYRARYWTEEVPTYFSTADSMFCVIAAFELVCRIVAMGPTLFLTSDDWYWNCFDLFVVVMQVVDEMVHITHPELTHHTLTLSVMRVLRLTRVLRLLRSFRSIAPLRTLVVSILTPLHSLVWLLILLAILTFIAGIPLTQLATDYKLTLDTEDDDVDKDLERFYGTLDRTMLALYETLSEGIHWGDIQTPLLKHCSHTVQVFFVLYSAFSLFAMMNVVTGIFVESALSTAEAERKEQLLNQMRQLFIELDEDGSGAITEEEFEEQMKDPRMWGFLKAIDLVPQDAGQLFGMIDVDHSGEIDPDELISGCVRLTGSAKALELAAFTQMFVNEAKRWHKHFHYMELCTFALMGRLSIPVDHSHASYIKTSHAQPTSRE
eukprot:TRINITY_DN13390_c0_g1_i1.p1 TRINITY_DN13390_c0_g1~~TRINITY_DN13390_c0_g1_i1.p1  ORF type:complete len:726 (+),score=132.12 TRINITY_DN13390_c0_g1_i1:69-2180(+)